MATVNGWIVEAKILSLLFFTFHYDSCERASARSVEECTKWKREFNCVFFSFLTN